MGYNIYLLLRVNDFSSLKNQQDRDNAVISLDTTADMFFEALRLLDDCLSPTISFENVALFANSIECQLLLTGLVQRGYTVHKTVLNAADFNGYTNRKRCYIFASTLPAPFSWPTPVPRTVHAWNDVLRSNLDQLKRIKSTSTIEKAVESTRERFTYPGIDIFPTLTKSQFRYTKDSVYVVLDGEYYVPSVQLMMELMGINDFDLSFTSLEELRAEIIGQSVEVPMHRSISAQHKAHLLHYHQQHRPIKSPSVQLPLW
jgi:DNA (cytosine-5)-methyltransferase 1